MVTFAVRYALGRETLAPATMKRIILGNLDVLHEQTKRGIIQDIEDYIDQHETVADLTTWKELMNELRQDNERKRKNDG